MFGFEMREVEERRGSRHTSEDVCGGGFAPDIGAGGSLDLEGA